MKEKFSDDEFVSLLESLEQVLEMLEEFHLDGRFEYMDYEFKPIESYKKAVSILKGVSE